MSSDQMACSWNSDDGVDVHLSDAARFSYAALVALIFHRHYANEEDRGFRQSYMQKLVLYLGLQKSQPLMEMFMETGEQETEPYLNLLMKEPSLQGDATLLITESLTFWIKDGIYDARIRVIIQDLAALLKLSPDHFDLLETSIGELILHGSKQTEMMEEGKRDKQELKHILKKYTLIGAASISGGIILGLSGGMAAPLFGAGLAALLGTSAIATTTAGGTALLASLFGAAGAGITGYKMKKRIGEVEEFEFIPLTTGQGSRLHITIAVPGWLPPLKERNDTEENLCQHFMAPWKCLMHSREQYGLLYETKYMMTLGSAINMVYDMVFSTVATEALKLTVLQGLIAAVALPQSVLSLISVIDNPWSVCCSRAVKVGELLAKHLMDRKFGHRPITLVGFSLGARVIYFCLRELQRRGAEKEIVQDAVLIGAPVTGDVTKWQPLLQVVAGRLVNAYSKNDWLLKYLYRVTSAASHVAGLEPIDIPHRRMINIDLSEVIGGHGDYLMKANDCLKATLIRTKEMEEPPSASSS